MHAKRIIQKDGAVVTMLFEGFVGACRPVWAHGSRQVKDLRGLLCIGFLSRPVVIFSLAARAQTP